MAFNPHHCSYSLDCLHSKPYAHCVHISMHPPLNFSPCPHSILSCTGPVVGNTTFWSKCLHGAPQVHLCTHTAMHALTWHSFSTLPLVHPQPLLSKHTGEREHGRMEGGSVYVCVCVCVCGGGGGGMCGKG